MHVTLDFTPAAKDHLGNRGYDPVYGARPLKRVLQTDVETPLAHQIVAGDLQDGMRLLVDVNPTGGLQFTPVVEAEVTDASARDSRAG